MHKMGGTNDGLLRDSDTEAVGPSSNRNIPEGGNVKSEIDDYIESLWVSVVTRWQDTNGLLAGPRIRKVSEEELTTFSKSQPMVLERSTNALKGLKFISKVEGMTWATLEKRFNDLTMDTDGLLPRSRFWECIGMNKDSQELGGELFDALSRRRNLKGDSINKEEMKDFWDQISDQSFESRLQTFFDMIDKDDDGRITEEEVREIIIVSASANNLPKVKNQADEYAALIMEELDPDNLGYIMIEDLEMLLLQAPQLNVQRESQMLSEKLETAQSGNPIKRRWYENLRFPKVFINSSNGVPAQDYKKYGTMLLVGSGIEATPIINIVKDILNNIEAKEKEEENGNTGTSKLHKKKPGPTRAYFYWVTKNRGSFYTVKEVMNEAAEMDKNGVMEMHIYCTNESKEDDARPALMSMLQSLNHAKNGVDVVSETRVKSHFAKPNWFGVYHRIALTHSGSRIGVIYCGEPAPGKELKQLAHEFSHETSTKFKFHKENL